MDREGKREIDNHTDTGVYLCFGLYSRLGKFAEYRIDIKIIQFTPPSPKYFRQT